MSRELYVGLETELNVGLESFLSLERESKGLECELG